LDQHVFEVSELPPSGCPQDVLRELSQKVEVEFPYEGRKLRLSESLVEGLVAGGKTCLRVEGAEDVRDRRHAERAQGFQQSADQALRCDVAKATAVAGFAGSLHERRKSENGAESVSESGNMGSVQRWPPFDRTVVTPTERMAGHR
jgi:hypothetical protein